MLESQSMDKDVLLALLEQCESVYKRGVLTFWLLLMLYQRPMYAFKMGSKLAAISQGTITAEEKSLYRALRRLEAAGLVESSWQPSDVGPHRRYYHLTQLGSELLRRFAQRNILIFHEPAVAGNLAGLLQSDD